jgi:hypothetical protein
MNRYTKILSVLFISNIYSQEKCIELENDMERLACYDAFFKPSIALEQSLTVIQPPVKSNINRTASKQEPNSDNIVVSYERKITLKDKSEYKIIGISRDSDLKLILTTKDFKLKLQETINDNKRFYIDETIIIHKGLLGFFISKKGTNKKYRVSLEK